MNVVLDDLDVPARLDEFRSMKDGWYEGYGIAPSHAGLDWLSKTFTEHYPRDVVLPYTYPTVDGNIQMEWHGKIERGSVEIILEINLKSHVGNLLIFVLESDDNDDGTEMVLDIDSQADWERLVNEIKKGNCKKQVGMADCHGDQLETKT